ncbi:MAG: hypothetical protein AVDCRST_MAG54-4840, partial [uncultured Actinomycetospora sp.]
DRPCDRLPAGALDARRPDGPVDLPGPHRGAAHGDLARRLAPGHPRRPHARRRGVGRLRRGRGAELPRAARRGRRPRGSAGAPAHRPDLGRQPRVPRRRARVVGHPQGPRDVRRTGAGAAVHDARGRRPARRERGAAPRCSPARTPARRLRARPGPPRRAPREPGGEPQRPRAAARGLDVRRRGAAGLPRRPPPGPLGDPPRLRHALRDDPTRPHHPPAWGPRWRSTPGKPPPRGGAM